MMKISDDAGRRWRITAPFLPWRSWFVRMIKRDEKLVPVPGPDYPTKDRTDWVEVVLGLMFRPDVLLGGILLSPFLLAELVLRLLIALPLSAARRLGWARGKVEVIGHTAGLRHSYTVLLTRAPAADVVAEIAAERAAATRSFHPSVLDSPVEVRSHRSIWQASSEWV